MRVSEKLRTKSEKLATAVIFFFAIFLLSACSQEDDKIVIQTQHQWVDKKVAVV